MVTEQAHAACVLRLLEKEEQPSAGERAWRLQREGTIRKAQVLGR